MITESDDDGQEPFEIVQANMLTPGVIPVIPEVGEVGEVMLPLPETSVQRPVPVTGELPASVVVGAQTV